MSSLEKLTIRGIRNFGEREDQKIDFTSPVTLIVGENGAGKTTIIESIKYALVNQFPPNCSNGQGFVNDPDMHHMNETNAQVRLKIQNLRQQNITVSRMCKATKGKGKKAKTQFKSVDQTIAYDDKQGAGKAVSKRVQEVNEIMCSALGVSEAIINDVLFCHQEEASWPLGTDRELKEKFDSIFGTSKYNKVVDNIRARRKKVDSDQKEVGFGLDKMRYLEEENTAETIKLEKLQIEFDKNCTQINEYDNDIKPIDERLKNIDVTRKSIGVLLGEKFKLESSCKNIENNIQSLQIKIKEVFNGSESSLKAKMQTFQSEKSTTAERFQEARNEQVKIKNERESLETAQSTAKMQRALLVQKSEQEQELYEKRYNKINQLCKSLDIEVDAKLRNENRRQQEYLDRICNAIQTEQENLQDLLIANQVTDTELQNEIDKLREKRSALQSELSEKEKQHELLIEEKTDFEKKIKESTENQSKLGILNKKIQELNGTIAQFETAFNFNEIKEKIAENRNATQLLRTQLSELDKTVKFLHSIASTTADISSKEAQLETRMSDMRRLKNKHLNNLEFLFDSKLPENGFKRQIDELNRKTQEEINTIQSDIKHNQHELTELQINLKNKKNELKTVERDINKYEGELEKHCESTPYEEVLEFTRIKKSKLEFEYSTLKSQTVLYEKYIQSLVRQPCCPLCHKDMKTNEITDLTDELQEQISSSPTNITNAEKELKTATMKLEELLGLKSVVERLSFLKDTELEKVKDTLADLDKKCVAANAKKVNLEKNLDIPSQKLKKIHSIIGDMSLLDKAIEDQHRLQEEIEALKMKIPNTESDLTMQQAEEQRDEKYKEMNQRLNEIETDQNMYDEKHDIYSKLREKLNDSVGEKNRLEGMIQEVSQHQRRLDENAKQRNDLQGNIHELNVKFKPLSSELQQTIDKKTRINNENKKQYNIQARRFQDLQTMEHDVKRDSKDIRIFAEEKLEEKIEKYSQKITKTGEDLERKNADCTKINEKIEELKREQIDQESVERNLQDNIELRKLQKDWNIVMEEIEASETKLGDTDMDELDRERLLLETKRTAFNDKKNKLKGMTFNLEGQIEELNNKLKKPEYKNSAKIYHEALYKYKVLGHISQDFSKYCVAMENALLQYHSDKMERVNSFIRQLWSSIYRGNDIDYIKIHTEAEVTTSSTRRSYHYRVVQVKNDVDIDMRGRCSAGQRVLACLIIRIALAETFSANCGVLALDEPTTNLDQENIKSLIIELNRIIEDRKNQNNFMFIIITHDINFISHLSGLDYYYRVSRSPEMNSIISKMRRTDRNIA